MVRSNHHNTGPGFIEVCGLAVAVASLCVAIAEHREARKQSYTPPIAVVPKLPAVDAPDGNPPFREPGVKLAPLDQNGHVDAERPSARAGMTPPRPRGSRRGAARRRQNGEYRGYYPYDYPIIEDFR